MIRRFVRHVRALLGLPDRLAKEIGRLRQDVDVASRDLHRAIKEQGQRLEAADQRLSARTHDLERELADTRKELRDQFLQHHLELKRFTRVSRLLRTITGAADPAPEAAAQRVRAAIRRAIEAESTWDQRFEVAALCEEAVGAAFGDDPRIPVVRELVDDLARRYLDEHMGAWGNVPFKNAIRERTDPSTRMRGCLSRYLRAYREQVVTKAVQEGLLVRSRTLQPALRFGVGLDERAVELPLAFDFAALHTPGRVLDAGGSLNVAVFRSLVQRIESSVVHVTLTADAEAPLFDRHHYSYVFSDLRRLEFRDGSFDRAICVSTLEHVGMDNTRYGGSRETDASSWADAAREIVRVVKPGGQVLITVPYGEPADHGWYHTFGPDELALVASLPGVAAVDSRYFYYDRGWYEGAAEERPAPASDAVTGLAVLYVTRQ